MLQYLNGLTTIGKTKSKSKFSKPFKSFSKNIKKLDDKAKALNKKINDDAKKLAKSTGKGIKRIAKIPNSFAFKKLLWALEHDFMGLSTRIKMLYKQNPEDTKKVLSDIGNYSKIILAVNKGAKGNAISGGYDYGCKCGNQNVYAQECCKGKHSAKSMVGEVSPEEIQQYAEYSKEAVGLIQKILDWFKKRKASKLTDDETIKDMQESVDADSNIPKEDESGNELPVSPLAPKKDSMLMPIVIGSAILVGGYFLLKPKK